MPDDIHRIHFAEADFERFGGDQLFGYFLIAFHDRSVLGVDLAQGDFHLGRCDDFVSDTHGGLYQHHPKDLFQVFDLGPEGLAAPWTTLDLQVADGADKTQFDAFGVEQIDVPHTGGAGLGDVFDQACLLSLPSSQKR